MAQVHGVRRSSRRAHRARRDPVRAMGAPRRVSRAPLAAPLAAQTKAQAFGLGFDLAGVTALGAPVTAPKFDAWLAGGYAGEMHYLERGAELRRDARRPEPGMRSAVVVAMNYGGTQPPG